MSLAVQVTYWATMLSAFDLNLRECLCWPRGGDPIAIKSEEKLSVVSLIPPTPAIRLSSKPDKRPPFCLGASDLSGPMPNNIHFLDPELEQLLKRTNARVAICVEFGAGNSLILLKTKSQELSKSDRTLISNYLTKNLPIDLLVKSGSMKSGERYHLLMEVLFTPQSRIPKE